MPAIDVVLIAMKPGGSGPMILAPLGVPERERVQDRAGAERGNERIYLRDFRRGAVEQADQRSAGDDDSEWQPATDAELNLQADRQDMPQTMPKPMVRSIRPAIIGNVAASDSSAMIALSLRIERALSAGSGSVRQKQREKDNQQDRQDRQAIDWRQTSDRSPAR